MILFTEKGAKLVKPSQSTIYDIFNFDFPGYTLDLIILILMQSIYFLTNLLLFN